MKYRVQNIVNNEYLDDDVIFLLPNGEVGWFIQDGSYPHYRKFGHQEDFRVINEDCERLQKQLDIAVKCLKEYANSSEWWTTENGDKCEYTTDGYEEAQEALQQIKDLNK